MEQGNDIPSVIEEVFKRYSDGSYIKASMLPDLDLYVDQITTFLTRHLAKTIRFEDDKIMTKTMINNYTKNHLLPPPDKKKYSRDHILLMIFIYYFKNFLPISDIKTILGPLTDKYFHKDADLNLEAIYTTLFSKEDTFVQEVLENVMKQFHMSADLFPDAPKADQASLREFTFICMLSLDIYLKKQLIEAILDKK
ncbi:DUF1836 domain-containing protein [Coprococcus catus]|uniref:DUF1836 domain-containing protein n=1 Tax=Coprococcus catus TaxID=116085 RepID=UPI001C01AC2E|nr:DUF1836 domain-containing protein [Coprococcus catus]MBT9770252.1 DUF1836 domain-containing protein [Coprococcus catus]MCO7146731.1 DUF1836 domain-containing protein [Coprococcus catus]